MPCHAFGSTGCASWIGRGARMLGLEGAVQDQNFEALRQGLGPQTGEFIRQRHGSDRIGKEGGTQNQVRHLCDFTFSAPKSIVLTRCKSTLTRNQTKLLHASARRRRQEGMTFAARLRCFGHRNAMRPGMESSTLVPLSFYVPRLVRACTRTHSCRARRRESDVSLRGIDTVPTRLEVFQDVSVARLHRLGIAERREFKGEDAFPLTRRERMRLPTLCCTPARLDVG